MPPQSEIYTELPIKLEVDSVIFNKKVGPGVFISNSIVSKDAPITKIINTIF